MGDFHQRQGYLPRRAEEYQRLLRQAGAVCIKRLKACEDVLRFNSLTQVVRYPIPHCTAYLPVGG